MSRKTLHCPSCFDGDDVKRSRMRFQDWPLRLIGVRPYRCMLCNQRFHSRRHYPIPAEPQEARRTA
jgi:hypothetical protein